MVHCPYRRADSISIITPVQCRIPDLIKAQGHPYHWDAVEDRLRDAIYPAVHDEEDSVGVCQQSLLLQLVLQHHVGWDPKAWVGWQGSLSIKHLYRATI